MKNLLIAVLPALALLALGGCASISGLTSTEDDGVYYSSKDRTTAIVSAPAPASTNEAANPDYHGSAGSAGSSSARQGSGSDQYYDNTYSYMRSVPSYTSHVYYGPGLYSYAPYSPYTSIYTGYGGAYGYMPYAYGYADPFYNPYGYSGYGPTVSIGFGYGQPYYGGYYGGYGRSYGYGGYGSGFYDPYYYGGPYYGGYYGRSGYYGNNYYGSNGYYGGQNGYNGGGGRYRTSGHRNDRASDGQYSSGRTASSGSSGSTPSGGGRVRTNDMMAPVTPGNQESSPADVYSTRRTRTEGEAITSKKQYNTPRDIDRQAEQRLNDYDSQPLGVGMNGGQVVRDENRDRIRKAEPMNGQIKPSVDAASQPQDDDRRRGGFFQGMISQPREARNDNREAEQKPARQRSYDQPQQAQQSQRSYEQPQRTYEQPQRSYEQPQRSSQPSYSSPSNGGGGGGGGGGGHSRGRGD